ncbi:MAG: hypothetical protein ABSH44_17195 [Bryobacteraceae bacterium]|jgi:YD repeat-containing protein
MKLLRAVERLETGFVVGGPGPGCEVGLVWTRDESRVDRALEQGEWIAHDLYEVAAAEGAPACSRLVERVTTDGNDLGWVYDPAGQVVGRVVEIDGTLISFCRQGCEEEAPASAEASEC